MITELVISYPDKIAKYFELVINDYTFKPDKITWNDTYHVSGFHTLEKAILESDSDFIIFHQFYKIMQRDDLRQMVGQIKNSPENVFCVSVYPRTIDEINMHTTEKDEDIIYGDGTTIYKTEMLKKVINLSHNVQASNSDEQFIIAQQKLGYKIEIAPYVREWYIPGHEMISNTRHEYFIPKNW